jgi:integrase
VLKNLKTEVKLSSELQEVVNKGIMTYERALEVEMDRRSKIIKDHIEKVHPIKQFPNGRYYTKLNPEDYKHPKLVSKARCHDVEEAIYQYYFSKEMENLDNRTFECQYNRWHEDPLGGGKVKPVTMYRNESLYNQYLKDSIIDKTPITQIDAEKFELFFLDCIKRGITQKAFTNVKSLINKIYNYAIKQKLNMPNGHSKDMFKVIEIQKNEFKTTKQKPCERSYTQIEVGVIRRYILDNYAAPTNKLQPLALLGVLLTFFTGVRCGELAALKVTDFDEDNETLLIERTETRNQKTHTYSIKPPKTTASNRNINLTEDAVDVLKLILSVRKGMGIKSEYLFTDRDNDRLHCPRFIKTIETINKRTGLPYKRSMHDIRRTYASICYLDRVPLHVIQRELGHETVQQTQEYVQDLISKEEGKTYLGRVKFYKDISETVQMNNIVNFKGDSRKKPHKKGK